MTSSRLPHPLDGLRWGEMVAAACALVYEFDQFVPLLADELERNGGVVDPHRLLREIVGWLRERLTDESDLAASVYAWLERTYVDGPVSMRNWVVMGAVESLPETGNIAEQMRDLLGPELRRQLTTEVGE